MGLGLASREGLLMATALTILPLVILWVLVKILPPWPAKTRSRVPPPRPHIKRNKPLILVLQRGCASWKIFLTT
jgi:hypothetical protein